MYKTLVALKIENGQTKGLDQYGCVIRKIGASNAVNAIIQTNLVIITYKNNEIKSYNIETGNFIRTIKH